MKVNTQTVVGIRGAWLGILASVGLLMAGTAHAIDTDPGDYTALPDGVNAFVLYGQHAQRNAAFSNGVRAPGSPELKSEVGIARYLNVMRINDRWTVDPNILLPFGKLKGAKDLAVLGSASGVGDLLLAPAFKYKINPATGETIGFTPYISLPTGSYDSGKVLNLGENRIKTTLQGGYTRPIAPRWRGDAVADVTFFGNNTQCRAACGSGTDVTLKKDALYQVQGHLRYEPSTAWYGALSLSHSWGGEEHVNGASLGSATRTTAARITAAYFAAPNVQLLGTLGRDLSVENGLRENFRLNVRLLYLF